MAYTKQQFRNRRRKGRGKKTSIPQLTKKQQELLFALYEGDRPVAADCNGKTLSSLEINVGRGYIRISEGRVELTPAGERWVKQRKKNKRKRRVLEQKFEDAWAQHGDPVIRVFFDKPGEDNQKQVKIFGNDDRAFDVVFPDYCVAVEIQGGTYSGGAHVRGVQYDKDVKKKRDALAMGWYTIELTTTDLKTKNARKNAVQLVLRMLSGRRNDAAISLLQGATLALCDEQGVKLSDEYGTIAVIPRDSHLYAATLDRILDRWLFMRDFGGAYSYRRYYMGGMNMTVGQRDKFIAEFGQYRGQMQ